MRPSPIALTILFGADACLTEKVTSHDKHESWRR